MKKLILVFTVMAAGFVSLSQNKVKPLSFKEVKVGGEMPDVLFSEVGEIKNNYTDKERFSDFKGKLIILDFWNTGCKSCIEAFPHMEELQKKYDDKIQIFLVNRKQGQQDIDKEFNRPGSKITLPNLPSIINAEPLGKMFPHNADPYHVWIDGNGIVRVAGSALNTFNDQKIQDVLDGKPVKFIKDNVTYYKKTQPFYSLVHDKAPELLAYSSLLTRFTDTLADRGSRYNFLRIVDTVSGTIRNTSLNQEIAALYFLTLPNAFYEEYWKRKFYPFEGIYPDLNNSPGKVVFLTKDTVRYWPSAVRSGLRNDDSLRKHLFCYEQIVPQSLPEEIRKQYMQEDLNRYFGNLYNMQAGFEKQQLRCYVLVKTSNENKLMDQTKGLTKQNFRFFIGSQFYQAVRSEIDKGLFLVNETGIEGNVYMDLPENIHTLEELRKALQIYDLDIVKAEREWPVLVIRKKSE